MKTENNIIEVSYCMPNIPNINFIILYILYVNVGFQLTKYRKILVTYCSNQSNSDLLIRKTISSHNKLSFEEHMRIYLGKQDVWPFYGA